jgi:fibronectin type 3 domain-containing protein
MSIAAIPSNFLVQEGNGNTLSTWNLVPGATSYSLQRSTDGVSYSTIATPTANSYLDSAVIVGTQYFYQVASVNVSGTSGYTSPQSIVPVNTGDLSLGQIRLMAQQRADMVGSNFVTTSEWNLYINQAAFELYDLLVTEYEDYFMKAPLLITTTGSQQYTLPNDFYKLLGVDLGLANNTTAWITLKKFQFIERNRYVYPQINSTFFGVFNLQYRLMGNTLFFIPTPSAGQFMQIWYIPKLTQLLADTDILTGISGWGEYVIVDAAIRAMQKQENDVSVLAAQKMMLIKRIEETAMNRDSGQPDKISATRFDDVGAGYGFPNGDGAYGGY